jgi:small subunit ribosomal protein S17
MIGRVVSAKMQKTVAVLVEGKKTHPLYKKTYVWSKKYLVRDEIGAKLGDIVIVEETKPISKRVHWKVIKILGADVVALGEAAMKQVEEEAIAEVMPEEKEEEVEAGKDANEAEVVVEAKAKKEPKSKTDKKVKTKKEAK